MIVQKEAHTCQFKTIKLQRIMANNPLYQGTTGDKAIICRGCKCGRLIATNMGPLKKMESLKLKLERK